MADEINSLNDLDSPADAPDAISGSVGDRSSLLGMAASSSAERGRLSEAENLYRQALEVCEQEYGKDNRKLLPLLNGIGQIYAEMGRFPDAEAAFAQAINILQASQKSYRPRDIEVVENYAQLLLRLGKQAESGQYAALALHLRQKLNSMPTLVKLATVLAPSTSMDARRFQHLVEQTADTAELLPATKRIRWRPILIVLLIAAWTAWALFLIF